MSILVLIIGANGAGKTTLARKHRVLLPRPFYNPDAIAEGLGDPNDRRLQMHAGRIVKELIDENLSRGEPFGFESTYSGHSRPQVVREARERGYTTRAIFLQTQDPRINVARVRRRVAEGGHYIDPEEIRRRWHRAWENLLDTWALFEQVEVVDTSGSEPVAIARKDGPEKSTITMRAEWAEAIEGAANGCSGSNGSEER